MKSGEMGLNVEVKSMVNYSTTLRIGRITATHKLQPAEFAPEKAMRKAGLCLRERACFV